MDYGKSYARSGYPGSRYSDLYKNYQDNPVDQIGPSLDTTNPRPSYQAAAGGAGAPAPTGATQPLRAQAAPGTGSPELAGLKHSMETLSPPQAPLTAPAAPVAPQPAAAAAPVAAATPTATPAYLQSIQNAIAGLTTPMTTAMDPAAWTAIENQVTRGNQRASNLAAEQLRSKMGGATGGLVAPGESGLADTALGGIYRGGASDTARTLGDISAEGARMLPQMNLQRLMAAGNLGQMLSGDEQSRAGFQYQQEMDALNYLMSLYGAEQGYQQNAWSPYYTGIVNAYGG